MGGWHDTNMKDENTTLRQAHEDWQWTLLPRFSIDWHLILNLSGVSLLLKEIQKNGESTRLFSEVGDNGARSSDCLLDRAIVVKLGKAAPGAKILSCFDHHNMDLTLGAKTLDELLVLIVLAVLGQAAQTGCSAIQGLGAFMKTLLESTMDHGLFKNLNVGRKKRKSVRNEMGCGNQKWDGSVKSLTSFKASRTLISTSSTGAGASATSSSAMVSD